MNNPNAIFHNDLTTSFGKQTSWVQFCFEVGKSITKMLE